MTENDDQNLDEAFDAGPPTVDVRDVESTVEKLIGIRTGIEWKRDVEIVLGDMRWRPSAVSPNKQVLLYVCLTSKIPNYAASRISEASRRGIKIIIALNFGTLYSPSTLTILSKSDAQVIVLDHPKTAHLRPLYFLTALARLDVPVDKSARVKVCNSVLARIGEGSNYEKGRRFEGLISFILSQVSDFRVVEQNFRTATQELDIVVQIDRYSERSWYSHVPFLLVEAKNWSGPVDQQVVSTFMTKIQTKGQSCKIGLLVGMGGFTREAMMEELRYSRTENRIVFIGPGEINALANAGDLDELLDEYVRAALLR